MRKRQDSLTSLLDQGVKGFKCFMIESGVDEFPMVTESDIEKAFKALRVGLLHVHGPTSR